MKLKSILKYGALALVCAATFVGSFSVVGVKAEGNDYDAKPDEYYSYVQKFTNIDQVNNAFHAWYRENALGSAKAEKVETDLASAETHWAIEDGVLYRINDVKKDSDSGRYETNQVAILTFTKEAYLNFELSVDVRRGGNGFWPVVGIRQLEEGKYHLDDGAGVFVQESGIVTLWGDPDVQGPHELTPLDGFDSTQWHNLQIWLRGNELKVSVDNMPWATKTLREDFYETGYVSLISVNNESAFRNFRIKALPEPEQAETKDFQPVPEADADDALSRLAGEVRPKEDLFEREPEQISPETPSDSTGTSGGKTGGGCKGAAGGNGLFLLLPFLARITGKNRRRNV